MKQITKAHETRRRFTLGISDLDDDDAQPRNPYRLLVAKTASLNYEDGARYVERQDLQKKMTLRVNNIYLKDGTFAGGPNLQTSRKSVQFSDNSDRRKVNKRLSSFDSNRRELQVDSKSVVSLERFMKVAPIKIRFNQVHQ